MEPISNTISVVVTYLALKLKENKTFKEFTEDFTSAAVNWIRPLFLENDNPNELLTKFIEDPDSQQTQNLIQSKLENELIDKPENKEHLISILETISAKESQKKSIQNIKKNIVTGQIIAGGNVIIGDKNIS